MQLPAQLQAAIEQEIAQCDIQALRRAASELSDQYRGRRAANGAFMRTEIHRLAYLAVRLPATFAAVCAVFAAVQRLLPERPLQSLLDLGAGPGTATWAAVSSFAHIEQISLCERDPALIELGRGLAASGGAALQNAVWQQADLSAPASFAAHDLVVCSYMLNELELGRARQVLQAAWAAAGTALVVIEPGTKAGFALIRKLRQDLVGFGAHLIAPCPHQDDCPLPADDWCHFPQRLARSSLHRKLKIGTLGYEDEKFSYIAAAKEPLDGAAARVVRHPQRHSGHVQIQLCAADGLQTKTVTRRDKAHWKRARKINWGDPWP